MTDLVSVVIPSYNHEGFVDEAVASVLAERDLDLELIVVDDGSTDGSRERLERWRQNDPRVRLELQSNRGAHAALNRGLELTRGDVILILDSDDAFVPGRIARLAAMLRSRPEATLIATWIRVVDAAGAELGVKRAWRSMPPWPHPAAGPHLSDTGHPVLALLEGNWIATTSNLGFPRRLVDDGLRFAPLRYAHDWDFILAACACGELLLLEEPLLRYRVHGANTIAEGGAGGAGESPMRFEALWVVARHAAATLARHSAGLPPDELDRRLWRSVQRFGRDDLLAELLALRGAGEPSPASYDALLDQEHPFRRAAVDAL